MTEDGKLLSILKIFVPTLTCRINKQTTTTTSNNKILILPCSLADLMLRRSWPTQNELHIFVLGFFWCICMCVYMCELFLNYLSFECVILMSQLDIMTLKRCMQPNHRCSSLNIWTILNVFSSIYIYMHEYLYIHLHICNTNN